MYGSAQSMGLDIVRYRIFANKVNKLHTLQPTAEAGSHHILRIYQRVQSWIGDGMLNPSELG